MDTKGGTQEQKASARASIPSGDETGRDASEHGTNGKKDDRQKIQHKHHKPHHSKHRHNHRHKHHHHHHHSSRDEDAPNRDTRKHHASRDIDDNQRTSKMVPAVSKTTDPPPVPPPPLIPTEEDVRKATEKEAKACYHYTAGHERVAANNSQTKGHQTRHESETLPRQLLSSETVTLSGIESIPASDVSLASMQQPPELSQGVKNSNQQVPLDSIKPSHNMDDENHHQMSFASPPSSQTFSPTLALDNSDVSPSNQAHGGRNVNIASTTTSATRSRIASHQCGQDRDIEPGVRPGAFAVPGIGGETRTVVVSADLVDTATEEQLREQIYEMEMRIYEMEMRIVEERNQIVDAEEVRPEHDIEVVDNYEIERLRERITEMESERARLEAERARLEAEQSRRVEAEEDRVKNNEIGTDEGKHRIVRWATAVMVLLAVTLAIVLGIVFGRRSTTDSQTPALTDPLTPSPTDLTTPAPTTPFPDFDELVALFSSTSPGTATDLQEKASNQYQAMEWLANDVEENGFDLSTDEDRILVRGALAIFFYSTNGDGWDDTTGWLEHGLLECLWYGLKCNTLEKVTQLDLGWKSLDHPENNLVGTLPREIHLLTSLEFLYLPWNSIGGTIATEMGNLKNMIVLDLGGNKFTGTLPTEILLLTSLKKLSVGTNSIYGTIATEIARLTNFRELWLHKNQLTGTMPSEIGLLTNLEYLSVDTNSLTGTVPKELGELKELLLLELYNNEFTGQVPSQVCAIDRLTWLWTDCGGSSPEIECTCCTKCCPGEDYCD